MRRWQELGALGERHLLLPGTVPRRCPAAPDPAAGMGGGTVYLGIAVMSVKCSQSLESSY